jgi:hypothetical protein
MNCGHKVILKGKYHQHTLFELEKLMKQNPKEIAERIIEVYGNNAIDVVMKYLPDSLQKEIFIGDLRNTIKYLENKKWNAERGRR